jgi:hypothetical protein
MLCSFIDLLWYFLLVCGQRWLVPGGGRPLVALSVIGESYQRRACLLARSLVSSGLTLFLRSLSNGSVFCSRVRAFGCNFFGSSRGYVVRSCKLGAAPCIVSSLMALLI